MAREKKHSVAWTICYAITNPACPEDPFFGTTFEYAKSAEKAKERFLTRKAFEAENCGECPAEWFSVVHVVEGFSC